jgi:hypothetical protein
MTASAANFKSEEADCESFFCDSARQVVVFLSLCFMPVYHARFHWTSKFDDNDVFGGFVDENDSGLSFESKLRSVCRKSCRFLSRSAIG